MRWQRLEVNEGNNFIMSALYCQQVADGVRGSPAWAQNYGQPTASTLFAMKKKWPEALGCCQQRGELCYLAIACSRRVRNSYSTLNISSIGFVDFSSSHCITSTRADLSVKLKPSANRLQLVTVIIFVVMVIQLRVHARRRRQVVG